MKSVAKVAMPLAVLIWYAVSMFSRETRVLGVAVCLGIVLLHPATAKLLLRNPVMKALVAITAVMLLSVTLQAGIAESPAFSQELAIRQLSYYFMTPVIVLGMGIVLYHYRDEFLSPVNVVAVIIVVAACSHFLPPITPEGWIWRANIENTMAFFYVFAFYVACRSTATRLAAMGAYLLYSVMTEAGQGVMIFCAGVALMFAGRLRAPLLYGIGVMPVWFPAVLVYTHSYNHNLDANIDFRFRIWSQIFDNFLRGEHVLGNFGHTVNPDFVKLLIDNQAGWAGIENIGAHNFVLQALQLGGFPGALAVICFLVTMAYAAIRSGDPRVQLCFIALAISCSLNQAEAHLLNLFGTGILAATLLVWPNRETEKAGDAVRQDKETGWLPAAVGPAGHAGGRF